GDDGRGRPGGAHGGRQGGGPVGGAARGFGRGAGSVEDGKQIGGRKGHICPSVRRGSAVTMTSRPGGGRPPLTPGHQVSLNDDFSSWYSAILALMLRRDRPQIRAQRPTLPRDFLSAFFIYWCSTLAVTSRSKSGSGLSKSMLNGVRGAAGCSTSVGRFSTWMKLSRDVTTARSIAFSSSRMLPGQR